MKHKDGFEKREEISKDYWSDPRWAKVKSLRKEGKQAEANGLVFEIRGSWGLD